MSRNPLKLRGAIALLSRAISHVGRGQPTNDWTDGSYCDPAIEKADGILRNAMWHVEDDLRKLGSER